MGRDSAYACTGTQLACWDVFTSYSEERYSGFHKDSTQRWCGTTRLTFDHFSDDQTRAFFKGEDSTGSLFRRLHEKQLVGAPLLSIQVREVVNDTGLPELQIDDEKKEISFNWKDMLDQLFVRIYGVHIPSFEPFLGS